jgi:thioredoxin-like negative regulator of GroEL
MAPIMNKLEQQYQGRINFVYMDVDDPRTATFRRELRYKAEPYYVLIDGQGKMLKQWGGYVKEEDFRQVFDAVLQ